MRSLKRNMGRKYLIASWMLMAVTVYVQGQNSNPYHINGNASQENCNCYTLTRDALNQSGSVWNINKIDLRKSFDFKFNVFLGCEDALGADGIAFVLQPVSTSIGATGGGLGVDGISPSIAVAIDTWQNTYNNDPSYDHIAIHRNGNINHNVPDNLAGPVVTTPGNDNIEDCKWHTFRIIWNADQKILKAQIDGIDRVETSSDLVAQVFNGDPFVFWGFTGATGGSKNQQRFCTSLNSQFSIPGDLETCFPASVPFRDESASFGTILKWYWDFGDGTKDSAQHPLPHNYPAPGEYKVKLQILGNNGCMSEAYEKKIIVGSVPVVNFTIPPKICEKDTIRLIDSSFVTFGTISEFKWLINGQPFSSRNIQLTPTAPGIFPVELSVRTKEGCAAASEVKLITINPKPVIDFTYSKACLGQPSVFIGSNQRPDVEIGEWAWKPGDGALKRGKEISYVYKEKGNYQVGLTAVALNGCISETITKSLDIYGTKAYAGNDTVIATNQPLRLFARGGDSYRWSPSDGLDNPNSDNPTATLQKDIRYILTASSPFGCETSDTIFVKVYKGPDIYLPNAFTPNGDRVNNVFRPIAPGLKSIDVFQIFNRYGQIVFSGRASEGWNGDFNGVKQPTGTYVWIVRGIDYLGKQHLRKGMVTLIR